ncbi:hypothetical protein [Acinetobacter sp. FDAARGOS_724]|uniref:hypothetical protein n=1 Tax=Acinetobacter sp. FDAARGOS_724 TaxID=2545797 RepID=UPI00158F2247|nr:hypothetical protein [Acinetobacter sp. FDAARGOS_724]
MQQSRLTRKQRRLNQRRKENSKSFTQSLFEKNNANQNVNSNLSQSENSLWNTDLTAFDDLR